MKVATILLFITFIAATSNAFSSSNKKHSFQGSSFSRKGATNREFYEVLNVDQSCTDSQVKQAFRKQAMTTHPDRGGNEEDYKKLVTAYETLSDPQKRAHYDQYGSIGNEPSGGFGRNDDIFENIFGRFSQFSMPIVYQVELTLEDYYKGRTLSLVLNGEPVDLEISPGMSAGMQLQHRMRDKQTGQYTNILFMLKEKKHEIFTRVGDDLVMEVKVSLADALFGFKHTATHLDGLPFQIVHNTSDILQHNDVLCVDNLGMPLYGQAGTKRGRLFVKTRLEMPRKMWLQTEQQRVLLKDLLEGKVSETSATEDTAISSSSSSKEQQQSVSGKKQSFASLLKANKFLRKEHTAAPNKSTNTTTSSATHPSEQTKLQSSVNGNEHKSESKKQDIRTVVARKITMSKLQAEEQEEQNSSDASAQNMFNSFFRF